LANLIEDTSGNERAVDYLASTLAATFGCRSDVSSAPKLSSLLPSARRSQAARP
jgi:hypothetical protein